MMTTTPSQTAKAPRFKAWLIEQKSLIALLVLILVVSFLSPNFFTADNLLNILRQTSVNAIIAVGMTLVILTAGIDLSVGSILALTGAFAAAMVGADLPVIIAIPAALLAGAALGGVSGAIIAKGKVQAFIATLVTMTALRGFTMVFTEAAPSPPDLVKRPMPLPYWGLVTGSVFRCRSGSWRWCLPWPGTCSTIPASAATSMHSVVMKRPPVSPVSMSIG